MAEKEKHVETAPDPGEDDLDDLDDVLDQFNAKPKPTPSAAPPPSASGPGRPAPASTDTATAAAAAAASSSTTAVEDAPSESELAAQLQSGMQSLIGELGEDPAMQTKFEAMMQELIAAGAAPSVDEAAEHVRNASDSMPRDEHSKEGRREGENFQETIRRTMERMQASGDAATEAATSSSGAAGGGGEEELLAQMMRELGGAGGGGEGSEEDFNKMLLSMMSQLTNKEILYEPMKELDDKFPGWMAANEGKIAADEMARYREQRALVREIVGRFEREGYSDESEADREYIVERMQKMQAAGSPPPDLVGDMSAAQDALGDLDSQCPTQ